MFDDLHSDDLPESPARGPDARRPLTDREVPLTPPGSVISDSVHAWLDGEATESSARRFGSARDVEFWKRMEAELVQRRRTHTPAGLKARIMASIPMHAPQVITPWWHREMVVTPSTAVFAMVALMALAATVTALLLR